MTIAHYTPVLLVWTERGYITHYTSNTDNYKDDKSSHVSLKHSWCSHRVRSVWGCNEDRCTTHYKHRASRQNPTQHDEYTVLHVLHKVLHRMMNTAAPFSTTQHTLNTLPDRRMVPEMLARACLLSLSAMLVSLLLLLMYRKAIHCVSHPHLTTW